MPLIFPQLFCEVIFFIGVHCVPGVFVSKSGSLLCDSSYLAISCLTVQLALEPANLQQPVALVRCVHCVVLYDPGTVGLAAL